MPCANSDDRELSKLLIRSSRGQWRDDKADEILAVAAESLELWANGGVDFDELADDIAIEIRLIKALDAEIAALDDRIEALYEAADPAGIVASGPGIGVTSAAGISGRIGDLNRFRSLAGIRDFAGLVPTFDRSGIDDHNKGPNTATPGYDKPCFSPLILPARSTHAGSRLPPALRRPGKAPQLSRLHPRCGVDDPDRSMLV